MEKSKKGKEKASSSDPSSGTSEIELCELPKNPTKDGSSHAKAKNDQVGSLFGQSGGHLEEISEVNPVDLQLQGRLVEVVEMRRIQQETNVICSMDGSYDNCLFTGCVSGKAVLWHQGQEIGNFQSEMHSGPAHAIAVHVEDDNFLCASLAHSKGLIRAWRKELQTAGNFLPVATLQKRWDYIMDRIIPCRPPHKSNLVNCLCLSENSTFIYSGAADGTLNTWRTVDYKLVGTTRCHRGPIRALTMGPEVVFSGGSDHVIIMQKREPHCCRQDKVIHLVLGRFPVRNEVQHVVINSLLYRKTSLVNGWLYAGCSDGRVRCWKSLSLVDPEVDKCVPEAMVRDRDHLPEEHQQGFHDQITCLAIAGPFVFSGSTDGIIRVWKIEQRNVPHRLAKVLQAHSGVVNCIAAQNAWHAKKVSIQEQWVLYSSSDNEGTLKIWSVVDKLQEERRVQQEQWLQRWDRELQIQEDRYWIQEQQRVLKERQIQKERNWIREQQRVLKERQIQEERNWIQEQRRVLKERQIQQRAQEERRALQRAQEERRVQEERQVQENQRVQEERQVHQEERQVQEEQRVEQRAQKEQRVQRRAQEERRVQEDRQLQEERRVQEKPQVHEEEIQEE